MIIAEILYPEVIIGGGKVKCVECELSYQRKDYKTLYDASKLKYFFISTKEIKKSDSDIIVCHNCLFDILKDLTEEAQINVITFKILTHLSEIELQYDIDMGEELYFATNMDDFLAGLDSLDAGDTDDTHASEDDDPDWGI